MYVRGMDCGFLELHNSVHKERYTMDEITTAFAEDKILRIDGGPAGVYYAQNMQEYYQAITKIKAIGNNYTIEVI